MQSAPLMFDIFRLDSWSKYFLCLTPSGTSVGRGDKSYFGVFISAKIKSTLTPSNLNFARGTWAFRTIISCITREVFFNSVSMEVKNVARSRIQSNEVSSKSKSDEAFSTSSIVDPNSTSLYRSINQSSQPFLRKSKQHSLMLYTYLRVCTLCATIFAIILSNWAITSRRCRLI